jgi:hypothetical protein
MIRITRSQSLGTKGEQWFPAQLPEYWHFQKPTNDLGIDGVVVIAEQNHFNGMEFRVQIKSSKEWNRKGDEIILRGVKRNTARTWVAGPSPTLLVFYDDSSSQGFCTWALEALPPIPELLFGRSSTITVKVKQPIAINPEGWDNIRTALEANAELRIKEVKIGTIANIVFPRIQEIIKCLRLLHLNEFTPDPSDNEKQMLLSVAQACAHRDIILSTTKVLIELDPGCLFARKLQRTVEAYKGKVSDCYIGFDSMLSDPVSATAVHENRKLVQRMRPEMIHRVTDLLLVLSSLGADSTNA